MNLVLIWMFRQKQVNMHPHVRERFMKYFFTGPYLYQENQDKRLTMCDVYVDIVPQDVCTDVVAYLDDALLYSRCSPQTDCRPDYVVIKDFLRQALNRIQGSLAS